MRLRSGSPSPFRRAALPLIALLLALPACMEAQDARTGAQAQTVDSAWVEARMLRVAGEGREAREAVAQIVQGGARVLPFAERRLRAGPDSVRKGAATVLASLGKPGMAALAGAVRDSTHPGSFWAQVALHASPEPAATDALAALLRDPTPAARERAVVLLSDRAMPSDSAAAAIVPLLRPTLRDPAARVRAAAAEALSHRVQDDSATVAALVPLLRDGDVKVRINAAAALDGSGRAGRAAVPALAERLRADASDEVRWRAAAALGSIGDTAAVPALRAAYKDASSMVDEHVIRALGQVGLPRGPGAQEVLDLLTDLAVNEHGLRAWYAAGSLAQLDDRAVPSLLRVLAEGDSGAAESAASALSVRAARPDVVEGLYRALGDRRALVRNAAADAVTAFGPAQLPRLRTLAAHGSAGAARAARMLESALASPVAEKCYALRRGEWTPKLDLRGDSAYSAAPAAVRFTTHAVRDERDETTYSVVTLAGSPGSVLSQGGWNPVGRDSLRVSWGSESGGVAMDLRIEPDGSLRGTAAPWWEWRRDELSAPVTGTRIPCREEADRD